ncbi:ABC transporter ATP-binding protein [uncultured Pseudokineococcus sp.]|uniref:ABC transporter ATP-binding protein n=1 Tax=uncultured Pseudokineococcus sp. TaxID=1642928 RepID=UPI00263A3319|nr:ATP-binding cassette domain-containing protein [uncultured Pseudokineococcus sp.]
MLARGWSWRHGGRRAQAVAGLDLEVEPGERVLLLGPSGSGKSTLLAGLVGVLPEGDAEDGESAGELLVGGAPAGARRGRAGLVLQDPESQVVLARVGDDVAFGPENLEVPREEIWPRVRAALDAVGLDVPLDHPTAALSGGQKQRLALAGVLAMRPGLVLLDEPTANLDPAGVVEVRDAVVRALDATGATLVVVEHRVAVWADVVDRVVVLGRPGDEGGDGAAVVADGPPEQVLAAHGDDLAARGVWVPPRFRTRPLVPAWRAPTPGEDLLAARELACARPGGPVAVRSADLVLPAASCTALTGANGAGKTTLALTLAGLLEPVGGAVVATGALADGLGPSPWRWRSRDLLRRVGTVFQDPEHQLVAATVEDELSHGPRLLGRPEEEVRRRTAELLERLRLTALARAHPFTLSGGEKRRLSVATALATGPRAVVLDEPTFGQDALTWAELVELLRELVDGGAALLAVTHDADLVEALGARTHHLEPPDPAVPLAPRGDPPPPRGLARWRGRR